VTCASIQVLDNVDELKQQMLLTYSEARLTAAARQPGASSSRGHSTNDTSQHGNCTVSAQPSQGVLAQGSLAEMCLTDNDTSAQSGSSHGTHLSRERGQSAASSSTDALGAFLAELQTTQDVQAAKTAAALQEMRAFAGQQELRMLQVRQNAQLSSPAQPCRPEYAASLPPESEVCPNQTVKTVSATIAANVAVIMLATVGAADPSGATTTYTCQVWTPPI
jgi:hypothetical protein